MDVLHEMVESPGRGIRLRTDPTFDEVIRRSRYYYEENMIKKVSQHKVQTATLQSMGIMINDLSCPVKTRTFIFKMSRIINYIMAVHGAENAECDFPTNIWDSAVLTEAQGNALTFGLVVVRAACSSSDVLSTTYKSLQELMRLNVYHLSFVKFCYKFSKISLRLYLYLKFKKEMELVYAIAATYHSSTFHNDIRDVSKVGLNLRLVLGVWKHKINSTFFPNVNQRRWNSIVENVVKLLNYSNILYNEYNDHVDVIRKQAYKELLLILAASYENDTLH
ncbi:hypothetical protein CHUAL_010958 [Chamberlinius hualienensis]